MIIYLSLLSQINKIKMIGKYKRKSTVINHSESITRIKPDWNDVNSSYFPPNWITCWYVIHSSFGNFRKQVNLIFKLLTNFCDTIYDGYKGIALTWKHKWRWEFDLRLREHHKSIRLKSTMRLVCTSQPDMHSNKKIEKEPLISVQAFNET